MDRNLIHRAARAMLAGVALRKESVDRNGPLALSGPRAHVALRKESVDRNNPGRAARPRPDSRSPQGERG